MDYHIRSNKPMPVQQDYAPKQDLWARGPGLTQGVKQV
jgi:hypothetical protein